MPNINRRPPVDTSQANLRNADQLRAERETISQPRNVLVNGGGEALVNRRALLETHRSFQAVMKQVDPTTARLQARPSPAARAAAPALSRPAPNLFERFAQAVSTTYHEYRANSAASDLARQIKGGRFDAGSVDLLASLTQHAAHLDPAGARQARSHPAITLLQGKLAGADGDTLMQVRNSPVFGDLKAANAREHAANEAMLKRLEGLGFGGGAEVSGAGAAPPAGTALKSNRHLDRLSAVLAAACSAAHENGAQGLLARMNQQSSARLMGQIEAEGTLATDYLTTGVPASSPLAHLGRAQLSELSTFVQARFPNTPADAATARADVLDPDTTGRLIGRQALECDQRAQQTLTQCLKGLSEPARRQALLGIIAMDPETLQEALQPPRGNALSRAFDRAAGADPAVSSNLGTYLQRGALRMQGGDNSVQTFRGDGLPDQITFDGQRYQFDRTLGNGANGVAVRYSPMDGGGPGIVLKATHNPDGSELGPGVANQATVGRVGREFANHMHAMGDDMQGHPNLLAAKGIIVAQTPFGTVRTSVATFGKRMGEEFSPTHLADSVSLFTVMEEAGPGPEGLVKDINLLRLTGTISEATHGLLMRSLFAQMVEGCAHLEDRQIAHRDLKLENMLVSQDGRVLIMDLGEGDMGQLTQPAPGVGTPLTQSPELHRGSKSARKVDTWALGVVWRQMSNSLNEANPLDATILNRFQPWKEVPEGRTEVRDGDLDGFNVGNDRMEWGAYTTNAIHKPAPLSESWAPHKSRIEFDRVTAGNLDGVQLLTNAMLHPDQAQRPTLAALRSHHAIADPALQDPRLGELTRAIQAADGMAIARLNQALTPAIAAT